MFPILKVAEFIPLLRGVQHPAPILTLLAFSVLILPSECAFEGLFYALRRLLSVSVIHFSYFGKGLTEAVYGLLANRVLHV